MTAVDAAARSHHPLQGFNGDDCVTKTPKTKTAAEAAASEKAKAPPKGAKVAKPKAGNKANALQEGIASVVMQTTLWVNRPGTPPVSEP